MPWVLRLRSDTRKRAHQFGDRSALP
jgi:hypothetical protein